MGHYFPLSKMGPVRWTMTGLSSFGLTCLKISQTIVFRFLSAMNFIPTRVMVKFTYIFRTLNFWCEIRRNLIQSTLLHLTSDNSLIPFNLMFEFLYTPLTPYVKTPLNPKLPNSKENRVLNLKNTLQLKSLAKISTFSSILGKIPSFSSILGQIP